MSRRRVPLQGQWYDTGWRLEKPRRKKMVKKIESDNGDDGFQRFARLALSRPDELRAAITSLKEVLPQLTEMVVITAGYRKKKFDALVGAGFSEKQALELCKDVP